MTEYIKVDALLEYIDFSTERNNESIEDKEKRIFAIHNGNAPDGELDEDTLEHQITRRNAMNIALRRTRSFIEQNNDDTISVDEEPKERSNVMTPQIVWIPDAVARPRKSGQYLTAMQYGDDEYTISVIEYNKNADGWNVTDSGRKYELFPSHWAKVLAPNGKEAF